MAMNKTEQAIVRNVIRRLKKQNCGCYTGFDIATTVTALNRKEIEVVSRIYLDTWILPALEALLDGDRNAKEIGRQLSAE